MPKKLHNALLKRAIKLKLKGERKKKYIFGTMAKLKKQGKIK